MEERMTCITQQHVGKYTYLYESTSYRDERGRPRNKKVRIGKLDPNTGEAIYNPEYLECQKDKTKKDTPGVHSKPLERQEAPAAQQPDIQTSVEEILNVTKNYGSFYVFRTLAETIGLLPLLKSIFPEIYKEIFVLSCFLIETQDPLMYCEEWMSTTETFTDIHNLNSQFISRLLSKITETEKNDFFESWIKNINDSNYIALDITSISSYSDLIDSCEWGYNRDKEKLRQINLCMLFGEGCKFPVFFKDYPGSISDVTTLKTTISEIKQLAKNINLHVAMDKGFYSKTNIKIMLDEEIDFLISVPFKDSFAVKQVESERKDIDSFCNTILTSEGAIRGVHKERVWNYKIFRKSLHTHIYYNPIKAAKERNELYAYVTELRQEAIKNPNNAELKKEFDKYLIIRKSSKNESGYTINVREEIVEEKLHTCGWMILLSNYIDNSQYALDIYRKKDVVEKCFDRLKNSMDLKRLRVHNDSKMKNKIFISFIAIIIISVIHQKMIDKNLYKKYTMHEMILKLRKMKIAIVRQKYILQPISKEQREILQALSVPLPAGLTDNRQEARVVG